MIPSKSEQLWEYDVLMITFLTWQEELSVVFWGHYSSGRTQRCKKDKERHHRSIIRILCELQVNETQCKYFKHHHKTKFEINPNVESGWQVAIVISISDADSQAELDLLATFSGWPVDEFHYLGSVVLISSGHQIFFWSRLKLLHAMISIIPKFSVIGRTTESDLVTKNLNG